MQFRQVRNILVRALADAVGCLVIKDKQNAPQPQGAHLYYSVLSGYQPGNQEGARFYEPVAGSEGWPVDFDVTREETPSASLSFSACAPSEDEALTLAEAAQAFFLHSGRLALSQQDIVVQDVTELQDRSVFEVDTAMPRWGFDLRVEYVRSDRMRIATVEEVNMKRRGT